MSYGQYSWSPSCFLCPSAAPGISSVLRTLGRMDEHFDVIYINETFNRDEWHTFEVGKTRFSDQALAEAGKHYCWVATRRCRLTFTPLTFLTHQARWSFST